MRHPASHEGDDLAEHDPLDSLQEIDGSARDKADQRCQGRVEAIRYLVEDGLRSFDVIQGDAVPEPRETVANAPSDRDQVTDAPIQIRRYLWHGADPFQHSPEERSSG